MPLADSLTNPLINSSFAQKSEPVVMMAEGGIADLPMDQEPRPAIADPQAEALFSQMRQGISPKEFSDEMLLGAEQADPQAVAEFRAALEELDVPPEVLDLLNNLVDEVLANPADYEKIKEKYKAQGVTDDILPEQFDAQFFAALNLAVDQLRAEPAGPQAFAKGGIAELRPVARAIASYGRNGDTMLAHITPAEARMLKRRGGAGTINPVTGLPEFFLDKVKNAFSRIGNAIKSFAKSTVGRIVIGATLAFIAGPAAAAALGVGSGTAAAAAISGFVGGAGSTLIAGGNLRDALKAGAISGIMGGATAALGGAPLMGEATVTPGEAFQLQVGKAGEALQTATGKAASLFDAPSTVSWPEAGIPPALPEASTLPSQPALPGSMPAETYPVRAGNVPPMGSGAYDTLPDYQGNIPAKGTPAPSGVAPQYRLSGQMDFGPGTRPPMETIGREILAPEVGKTVPVSTAPSTTVPSVATVPPPAAISPAQSALSGGTALDAQAAARSGVPTVSSSIKTIGEGLGLGEGPASWKTFKEGVSNLFMPEGASSEAIRSKAIELQRSVAAQGGNIPYADAVKEVSKTMVPNALRSYGPMAAAGLGIMGLAGGFKTKEVTSPYAGLFTDGPGSARDLMRRNPYKYYIQNLPGVTYYEGSVLPPPGYAHGGAVQHFEEGGTATTQPPTTISNEARTISDEAILNTPAVIKTTPVTTPAASQIGTFAARAAEVATPAAGGYNQFFPAAQNVFYGDLNRRLLSGIPSIDPNIGAATPEQKADYYNQLIGQGYTDPQIRAGVGPQTNADWAQLQQIAGRRPAITGGIGAFQAQPLVFPGQGELARLDAEYRKTMGDRPPAPDGYAYPMGPSIYLPDIRVPTLPPRPTTLSVGTTTTTKPTTPAPAPLSPAAKQLQGSFDTSIFNKTPQEKAAYYNSLLASGYDDATIRAAIGAPLDENWFKLREIAGQLKAGTTAAAPATATPVQTLRANFDTSVLNKSPQEKAAYYNSLLGAGYDDATIRAAINAPLDANWLQLQQMAQGQRAASVAAPVAAPVPAPAPAVLQEPMPGPAQSFEDTYEPPAVYAPAAVSPEPAPAPMAAPAPAPAPMAAPAPAPAPSPLEQLRASFDMSVFARTPQEKAAYYNSLLGQGYDDATIRAAIDAPLDENWRMLQQLAANQGVVRRAYGGGIASLGAGGYPRRTGQISGPGTEKSDSIPAMLSDGEFVMTAKAVRGAGKGDRRAGAKKMYALMHQLERNASRG